MKRVILVLVGVVVACVGVRYGSVAVSYFIIPPERGYYRYYQNYDMEHREVYWEYWQCWGPILGWASLRERMSGERWELVRDGGHRYFLYDDRNEFDGVLTVTRSEMILRAEDGRERHFPRVLNLWEIWRERSKAQDTKATHALLAPRQAEHQSLIAARMKERGITVYPGESAQRRPPAIKPTAPDLPSSMQTPLFTMTQFGYHDDTGTVFALYADGTVICRSIPENPAVPYHRFNIPDAAQFCKELLGDGYSRQPEEITLSGATDQPTSTLWTPGKSLLIYGDWRKPDSMHNWSTDPSEELSENDRRFNERMRMKWESELATIYPALQKIDELRKKQGLAWLPAKVEVGFAEYEYAPDKSIEWPHEWPGLYDATSKKRGAGLYSVYVPADDFAKLQAFLDLRSERGAVMIDLNKMSPSLRFPFPSEEVWLSHLKELGP